MTHNVEKLIQQGARAAAVEWGGAVHLVEDLTQELWVWYLERPGTQRTLGEMKVQVARRAIRRAGLQILAGLALEGDVFQGRALYSSEAVKDALKGRSTNRYLVDILPDALKALEAQNERHREAIRRRYDDGVMPVDNAGSQLLKRAHRAITAQVNILVIVAGGVGVQAGDPTSRKRKGVHGDPTGDMAIALITAGDVEHELIDEGGNVRGSTTLRAEFYDGANIFDEGMQHPTLRDIQGGGNVTDGWFNGGDRSELYRAQVFPELYPHEKPMLVDNWPAEDREMWCGGEYTPGHLRLMKGEA